VLQVVEVVEHLADVGPLELAGALDVVDLAAPGQEVDLYGAQLDLLSLPWIGGLVEELSQVDQVGGALHLQVMGEEPELTRADVVVVDLVACVA